MTDLLDEFLEFDFSMGTDVVECSHCGADVSSSLFFDDKVVCPECGKEFKKDS
ncbi:MAG: hypothetical protein KKH94_12905 [Candidatus Omnitrophica bacterium]|nr:hypothetical protein [Candidatus Omnitrophota bacterium]